MSAVLFPVRSRMGAFTPVSWATRSSTVTPLVVSWPTETWMPE